MKRFDHSDVMLPHKLSRTLFSFRFGRLRDVESTAYAYIRVLCLHLPFLYRPEIMKKYEYTVFSCSVYTYPLNFMVFAILSRLRRY